jgi:hypothetical protein
MSTIYTTAVFNDDTTNNGTVLNGIFTETSNNAGTVSAATFSDTAVNSGDIINTGVFVGSATNSGQISGTANFTENTINAGTVAGAVVFAGNAVNNSTVAEAIFLGNAINNGTVSVSALFADNAANSNTGLVQGYAAFTDNTTNAGTVSGNADFSLSANNTLGNVGGTVGTFTQPNGYFPNGYFAGGVKTAPADYDIIVHLVGSFWYKYDETGTGAAATGNYYDGSSWFTFIGGVKTVVYNKPSNARLIGGSLYTYLSSSQLSVGAYIFQGASEDLRGNLLNPWVNNVLQLGLPADAYTFANDTMFMFNDKSNTLVTNNVGLITSAAISFYALVGSTWGETIYVNSEGDILNTTFGNWNESIHGPLRLSFPAYTTVFFGQSGISNCQYALSANNGKYEAHRGVFTTRYQVSAAEVGGFDTVYLYWNIVPGNPNPLNNHILYTNYEGSFDTGLLINPIPASATYIDAVADSSIQMHVIKPILVSNSEGRFVQVNAAALSGLTINDTPSIVAYRSATNSDPVSALENINGITLYTNGTLTNILSNYFFKFKNNTYYTNNQGVATVFSTPYTKFDQIYVPSINGEWATSGNGTTAYSALPFISENIYRQSQNITNLQVTVDEVTYSVRLNISDTGIVAVTGVNINSGLIHYTDRLITLLPNYIGEEVNAPYAEYLNPFDSSAYFAFNTEIYFFATTGIIQNIGKGYQYVDYASNADYIYAPYNTPTSALSAITDIQWSAGTNRLEILNEIKAINGTGYQFVSGYATAFSRSWVGYSDRNNPNYTGTLYTPISAESLTIGEKLYNNAALTSHYTNSIFFLTVEGTFNDPQFNIDPNTGEIISIGTYSY